MILKRLVRLVLVITSKANLEDLGKIIVVVSLPETTREWSVKSGFVPLDIIKT